MTAPDVTWLAEWPTAPSPFRRACVWIGRTDQIPPSPIPLAPTEHDRAEAARRVIGEQHGFAARRVALRRFVASQTGSQPADVVVAADTRGQPRVFHPSGQWHVSGSARGGWLALALARHPVGVDIEPLADASEPAWNVLTSDERRRLGAVAPHLRGPMFLHLWTGKEAYLKAIGAGLRREPTDISVHVCGDTLAIADRGVAVRGGGVNRTTGGLPPSLCATVVILDGSAT